MSRQKKRIVVKVGSSSLTDERGIICMERMKTLVESLVRLKQEANTEVLLVSSGAVAAGLGHLQWSRTMITMPEKQAAAAVGQGLLIETYKHLFAEYGEMIAQLLLTRGDIEDRKRYVNIRNTLETLLHYGIIPIVNENDTVAVDEIRFGDNDTLGSWVGILAEADLVILLTDIDGLYTANPKEHPDARRIEVVKEITPELEKAAGGTGSVHGTGGMKTKLQAAKIAMQAGIELVIAHSRTERVIERVVAGEPLGTRFLPQKRLSGKKQWIAFGSKVKGRLFVDDGAADALVHGGKSLLAPGIVRIEGTFTEGDAVEIVQLDQRVIAKGIVNYSDADLRMICGSSEHHLREVVHRDVMILLEGVV
ncbi:glutamate 5-kinase [Collibacillus ludicampi]|uniref:Glutamate 5-kinase n=1 Tax=Collibacillus ludicampi TaxID=2771369 RepID=A0AAV4LBA9_9BACL|nr:glutamate 5-kinase [Collibacillus ludicampi]GIM45065.1 glutamate 5-kinase [Collibacillus ludicampi]